MGTGCLSSGVNIHNMVGWSWRKVTWGGKEGGSLLVKMEDSQEDLPEQVESEQRQEGGERIVHRGI